MEIKLVKWVENPDNDTIARDRLITLSCDGVERVANAYSDGDIYDPGYNAEFVKKEDQEWYNALPDEDHDAVDDAIMDAYHLPPRLMTAETHAHLVATLEWYAQSSSGREPENAEATEKAWNEINRLAGME